RHLLRLFFGVIAAVGAFGAVFVEPEPNEARPRYAKCICLGVWVWVWVWPCSIPSQQVGELSNVRRDASRLAAREGKAATIMEGVAIKKNPKPGYALGAYYSLLT